MNEWITVMQARKWMKKNESFYRFGMHMSDRSSTCLMNSKRHEPLM